jgi:hypothetical protein
MPQAEVLTIGEFAELKMVFYEANTRTVFTLKHQQIKVI